MYCACVSRSSFRLVVVISPGRRKGRYMSEKALARIGQHQSGMGIGHTGIRPHGALTIRHNSIYVECWTETRRNYMVLSCAQACLCIYLHQSRWKCALRVNVTLFVLTQLRICGYVQKKSIHSPVHIISLSWFIVQREKIIRASRRFGGRELTVRSRRGFRAVFCSTVSCHLSEENA